jgi:hypothetical protein
MKKSIINVIRQGIGEFIFDIKYKFGIAEEGKDFFNCREYDFCENCTSSNKPCAAHFK